MQKYLHNFLLSSLHALTPVPYLLFGFSSCDSICFLDLTCKLLSLAGYLIEIIIRKLAPVFLCRAHQLFPSAFHLFPIHLCLLNELLLFIPWLPVHRHSILGALLDRVNLTTFLNVAGMCGYGHIRNAEEVFSEYVAQFQAVEML